MDRMEHKLLLWTGQKGFFTARGAPTAFCCGCLGCLAEWVVCTVGVSSERFACSEKMSCCCHFPAPADVGCYRPLGAVGPGKQCWTQSVTTLTGEEFHVYLLKASYEFVYLFLIHSKWILHKCFIVMIVTVTYKTTLGSFFQHFRFIYVHTAKPENPTLLSHCFFWKSFQILLKSRCYCSHFLFSQMQKTILEWTSNDIFCFQGDV